MTRNEAIMNAWEKIREYVKENYNGTFEKGIEFTWKHEVYGWKKFGVTRDGVAYIVTGSHGTSSCNDWFYHPTNNKTYEPKRLGVTEDVVNDWRTIKEKLERLAEKENGLYNFEV